MRNEEININITLDNQNICEKILWDATNTPEPGVSESKAMTLAFWDADNKGTAKIDLWTKEMEVHEMKRFVIETISGLADTVRTATSDERMALEMETFCQQMSQRLQQELTGK